MPTRCIQVLLSGMVDYAGLFPPARLDMGGAVEEYARCRMSELEWMLGRFVCPVSRLGELSKHAAALMPGTNATSGYREHAGASSGEPWRIAALIDGQGIKGLDADLNAIQAFNRRHANEEGGLAGVDMIEVKAADVGFIDDALDIIPEGVFPFFEFPIVSDCRGFVAALAGNQSGAKVRTGGLTPGAIPTTANLAEFLVACAGADVPFKATAGLHHAVRSEFTLDTTPDAPRGVMHGFLNVFFAAAIARVHGLGVERVQAVLDDRIAASFRFTDVACGWKELTIEAAELALVRESFALSFGSCSFDEPVSELRGMKVL